MYGLVEKTVACAVRCTFARRVLDITHVLIEINNIILITKLSIEKLSSYWSKLGICRKPLLEFYKFSWRHCIEIFIKGKRRHKKNPRRPSIVCKILSITGPWGQDRPPPPPSTPHPRYLYPRDFTHFFFKLSFYYIFIMKCTN